MLGVELDAHFSGGSVDAQLTAEPLGDEDAGRQVGLLAEDVVLLLGGRRSFDRPDLEGRSFICQDLQG